MTTHAGVTTILASLNSTPTGVAKYQSTVKFNVEGYVLFVESKQCRSHASHNPGIDKAWVVGCSEFEELFLGDIFRDAMNNTPGGAKWWLHVGGNSVAGAPMRCSVVVINQELAITASHTGSSS